MEYTNRKGVPSSPTRGQLTEDVGDSVNGIDIQNWNKNYLEQD